MTTINSALNNTDHHCGWFDIIPGQTVIIVARKQMVCFGSFINDGILIVDGQFISES